MQLRDIMRPGTFTISDTDCLGNAHRAMTRSHIRHLPVTSGGRIVGMLSERDLLSARARVDDGDWWMLPVRSAMTSPAQTAGPADPVVEVAGRMAASKIGALPVVELGKLLGLVTVTDVLDAQVREAMEPRPSTLATAADAMTSYPFTVDPSTPLADAVKLMLDRHIRHVPVVDSASKIVGMLSERDVRTAIGDPVWYLERIEERHLVADVMTTPAIVIRFDEPLVDVARRFANERIGALPVVDGFGALLGIVSYVDALRILTGPR